MGNSDSHEVTFEKQEGKFVQTADGIKLSPALIQKLADGDDQSNKKQNENPPNDRSSEESARLAQECQILLDEREKQMASLAQKYQEDLENERQKHQQFYDLSIEEFEKSAKAVEKKFKKPNSEPVCKSFQDELVECYKNNPGRPLDCSEHLASFKRCVNIAKESVLSSRVEPEGA
uniref:CHCH domain-containing protein n=1 Tax=Ciona savignyi TaxID=51511 RepID=H2ZP27_CIOSA